jgi:hypothetical protein
VCLRLHADVLTALATTKLFHRRITVENVVLNRATIKSTPSLQVMLRGMEMVREFKSTDQLSVNLAHGQFCTSPHSTVSAPSLSPLSVRCTDPMIRSM